MRTWIFTQQSCYPPQIILREKYEILILHISPLDDPEWFPPWLAPSRSHHQTLILTVPVHPESPCQIP